MISKQVQPKLAGFYPLILITVAPSGEITELRPPERGASLVGAIRGVRFPPTQWWHRADRVLVVSAVLAEVRRRRPVPQPVAPATAAARRS